MAAATSRGPIKVVSFKGTDAPDIEPGTAAGPSRPCITVTNRPLRQISDEALEVLRATNDPPRLFVRAASLARTRRDELGRPIVETVTEAMLRGMLTRAADFFRETRSGRQHVTPSDDLVRNLLAREAWPFPALVGITEVPVLRPDGTLLTTPGYDSATRLIYDPAPGLDMPPIPDSPTVDDVTGARALLDELLCDFPFPDDPSRANVLALLLTPIIRPAIAGQVPLALLDKPQAGTGASLLANVVALIATGRSAAFMTAPRDDDEWRKRITSVLRDGATLILLDNVTERLESPNLAAALTTDTWQDRLLGRSESLTLPQRASWIATGINIRLGGDIPRRCYWIRLDAKDSRPWQRERFRHADLPAWVMAQRGDLLRALLVLARAWYAAGCPAAEVPVVVGFTAWSRILAGILRHAGVHGFLGNLNRLYEEVDDEASQWEVFLADCLATYGSQPFRVADLLKAVAQDDGRRDLLPDALVDALDRGGEKGISRRIGKALQKRIGTRFGSDGLYIERADTKGHVATWCVRAREDSRPGGSGVSGV